MAEISSSNKSRKYQGNNRFRFLGIEGKRPPQSLVGRLAFEFVSGVKGEEGSADIIDDHQKIRVIKSTVLQGREVGGHAIAGYYSEVSGVGRFVLDQFGPGFIVVARTNIYNQAPEVPDDIHVARFSFGQNLPVNPNMPDKGAFDYRKAMDSQTLEALKIFVDDPETALASLVELLSPTDEDLEQTRINHQIQRQIFSL